MKIAILLAAFAASQCWAAPPLAQIGRVTVSGESLMVGAADPAAAKQLECATSSVQRTIVKCKVPAPVISFTTCLGRHVDSVLLNNHFSGQIINMSVEFSADNNVDSLLTQLQATIGQQPKIQYWADDVHLYASYIWVDGVAEIEVTKTVKGATGDGKVRLYTSSLLGGLPLNPDDAPK